MWTPKEDRYKIITLAAITTFTVAIHYGYVFQPLFGHVHWIHALHGRFCYIPIVIAASWFGFRGGIYSATTISVLVLPFIFGRDFEGQDVVGELVEIVFYYFIGALIGWLVDREFLARRRQQEAELQVERSQKLSLVGQIAAGVAHEIKNPLASIKGAASILVDDNTSEDARNEFGGILQDEVRRIDSTVSEFLGFARPKETKRERTDLSNIISSCARKVVTQSEQAGVRIKTEIADDIFVTGDIEKLHQMTLNLILNAINASTEGSTITISLAKIDSHDAELTVEDEGRGMSPAELERVFEPFYTTRAEGTGLGLAIVKTIVDNHKGEIELISEVNHGTQARVVIPLFSEGDKI
ncbi:MAG: ATP-binding protein [candidate division Zixibacteria bacterium]|nr:ATP-binding protein [candidate division Zixibacteria bacterium]